MALLPGQGLILTPSLAPPIHQIGFNPPGFPPLPTEALASLPVMSDALLPLVAERELALLAKVHQMFHDLGSTMSQNVDAELRREPSLARGACGF